MHRRELATAVVLWALVLSACDSTDPGEDPFDPDDAFVTFAFSGVESGTFETSAAFATDLENTFSLDATMESSEADYVLWFVVNRPLGPGEFELMRQCNIIVPLPEHPPCGVASLSIQPRDGEPVRDYYFESGTVSVTAATSAWIAGSFSGTAASLNRGELTVSDGSFQVPLAGD